MYKTINLKEYGDCQYALHIAECEIRFAQKEGFKAIIFVHGYGSHGVGGVIKQSLNKLLQQLKSKSAIKEFLAGEEWGEFNETRKIICDECPALIINNQLNLNSGVTVVLV